MVNQHEDLEDHHHEIGAVHFIQKTDAMNAVVEDIMHVIVDAMDAVVDDAGHDRIVDQEVVHVIIQDHVADHDHVQDRVHDHEVVQNHVPVILVVLEIRVPVDTLEIVDPTQKVHRHESVPVPNQFDVRSQRKREGHHHRIDPSRGRQSVR